MKEEWSIKAWSAWEKFKDASRVWFLAFLIRFLFFFFFFTCCDAIRGKAILWPDLLFQPFASAIVLSILPPITQRTVERIRTCWK